MLNKFLSAIAPLRARRLSARSPYRLALADVPDTLFAYWQRSAPREFAGIPVDALFFARATEGLLMFFDIASDGERPCALPSKAADSVWHAWSSMSEAGLGAFCRKHYGREIAHVEASNMPDAMDAALANCLVRARRKVRLPEAGPGVPPLFTLDRRLKMPGGFGYKLNKGQLACHPMSRHGALEGAGVHLPGLAPLDLLAAGLITELAFELYMRKAKAAGLSGDGASCGSDCGSACGTTLTVAGADSGGSDSGASDSGGSSCSSSCSSGSSCGSSD